jgi:hypothetical protein
LRYGILEINDVSDNNGIIKKNIPNKIAYRFEKYNFLQIRNKNKKKINKNTNS